MERCGVLEVRRKLIGNVSRGYRQRVGLADALVASPPILILDEPTSGLDPNQRRKVKDLVRELADEHTILFSSHILAEVQDVSSRVIVIDKGQVKADGSPQELLESSAGRQLKICAEGTAEALRSTLGELNGMCAIDVVDEGAFSTLCFTLLPGADPRDEAFAKLTAANVRVRELRLDLPTLEEYFTHLTHGGNAPLDGDAPEDGDEAPGSVGEAPGQNSEVVA